jgi:hypothetical protein
MQKFICILINLAVLFNKPIKKIKVINISIDRLVSSTGCDNFYFYSSLNSFKDAIFEARNFEIVWLKY